VSSRQLPHPRAIFGTDTEIAAITFHIHTNEGPSAGNVIPAAISIHENQRCHIVNHAGCPTAAENCCHLTEFAGDLPVVMQFDAQCEVTPSAMESATPLYNLLAAVLRLGAPCQP
jgi:hypothetical protein